MPDGTFLKATGLGILGFTIIIHRGYMLLSICGNISYTFKVNKYVSKAKIFIMKNLIFFLVSCVPFILQAQQGFVVTGGDAAETGGSVSYSIGQVFYKTHLGTETSIVEGLQQPYEIYSITFIEDTDSVELVVSVFPNPVMNTLYVTVKEAGNVFPYELSCRIFDMHGLPVIHRKVFKREAAIDMAYLPPGIYVLKILAGERQVMVFKIIKKCFYCHHYFSLFFSV